VCLRGVARAQALTQREIGLMNRRMLVPNLLARNSLAR
jgi:hypothetical protein